MTFSPCVEFNQSLIGQTIRCLNNERYCSGKMIGWSFLRSGGIIPPLHPLYRLWNYNVFSCVYVIIQTSQTDLNITQATPSVILEGGVQESRPVRPGQLGLRSRRGWSENPQRWGSYWSTLLMRGGRASWASILSWSLFIFIDHIVFLVY